MGKREGARRLWRALTALTETARRVSRAWEALMAMIALSKLRRRLGPWVAHVEHTHKRIVILRHGRPVAALVTMDDMNALEEADAKELKYQEYLKARELERFRALKRRVLRGIEPAFEEEGEEEESLPREGR